MILLSSNVKVLIAGLISYNLVITYYIWPFFPKPTKNKDYSDIIILIAS